VGGFFAENPGNIRLLKHVNEIPALDWKISGGHC
jgi:hypothetical protein